MALPNSNISTTLVGQTLGTSSRDVGTLCTHPNINKWSRWKPVRALTNGGPLTDVLLRGANCGAILPGTINALVLDKRDDNWEYAPPQGGEASPYRIGDFRGYEKTAKYEDAPFGVLYDEITEAGSNVVINLLYGGGAGAEYIATPKNMSIHTGYAGISIFGGDDITTVGLFSHIYSYCAPQPVSAANANAFYVPKSLLTPYTLVIIIPFISENIFTSSAVGAGSSMKYIINGFAPQKTYSFWFPNGEPTYKYIPSNYIFTRQSSYSVYLDFDLVSQWIQDTFLYDTRVEIEYYSGLNATGTKVYERKGLDAPKLAEENVPAMNRLSEQVSFAWGGPYQSIRIRVNDRYRFVTYDWVIWNNA